MLSRNLLGSAFHSKRVEPTGTEDSACAHCSFHPRAVQMSVQMGGTNLAEIGKY